MLLIDLTRDTKPCRHGITSCRQFRELCGLLAAVGRRTIIHLIDPPDEGCLRRGKPRLDRLPISGLAHLVPVVDGIPLIKRGGASRWRGPASYYSNGAETGRLPDGGGAAAMHELVGTLLNSITDGTGEPPIQL